MLSNPWVKLVLQVGVPAAIAIFLVFRLSTVVDTKLDHQGALMQQHVSDNHVVLTSIVGRLEQSERASSVMINLMRAQCVNASKTYDERNRCLEAGEAH